MSFIDDSMQYCENDDYLVEQSPIGRVFIPRNDLDIVGEIGIRYEKHPWIEQFEFDGMRPHTPVRTGYGTRGPRDFAESLSKIYAKAYDEYAQLCDDAFKSDENKDGLDAGAYFTAVAKYFVQRCGNEESRPMYRKFCGFTENMWREGTVAMHDIALEVVLPIIESETTARKIFYDVITPEFKEYIEDKQHGKKED